MYKYFLGILLFICVGINAASIYGYSVSANGPIGGGTLSNVLGIPNDTFIQISNNTSVIINFAPDMAALANGSSSIDLRIHTYDQPSPVNGIIEISQDGISFSSLGVYSDANVNDVIDFDLDSLGFTHVVAIKITDISGTSAGFDLDAVEGFFAGPIPVPEPASFYLALLGFFVIVKGTLCKKSSAMK